MIEQLLSKEESKTLEFKENTKSLSGIIKTIIAFANTAGGTLVIGVSDKTKSVVGLNDVLLEEEKIANCLSDSVCPQIFPNFQYYTWRKSDLLIIEVQYTTGPYYIKSDGLHNGVYVRLGSTNRLADKVTVQELQRLHSHISFDESANLQASEKAIDFELAKKLFLEHNKKFTKQVAQSIQILTKHQSSYYPSNGGLILFGKNKETLFPNTIIKCGFFAGINKDHVLDQQDIIEPLPLALQKIISFIQRHTYKAAQINDLKRKDVYEYPLTALREAIINALVHTDYSIKGSCIQIAIFSDRLEILNPGALPYGLSLEKALSGISQLRNRVIGHVFRELKYIESWGSGLNRMKNICVESGLNEPLIQELDNYFKVVFFNKKKKHKVSHGWQKVIIEFLEQNSKITPHQACELMQVSKKTATSRLQELCELNKLAEISKSIHDPKKYFILK